MSRLLSLNNRRLRSIFDDIELFKFMADITHQLYLEIKDDIHIKNHHTDSMPFEEEFIYASHKMSVILDVCRESSRIKNLSVKYNIRETRSKNSILYIRYMTTLFAIHDIYLRILTRHPDYERHRHKQLNIYSGLLTIPDIINNNIKLTHMLDTTLKPYTSFVSSDDNYFLNIITKLDGPILPILGNCFKKFYELGFYEHPQLYSEFEILYLGLGYMRCINFNHIDTFYNANYFSSLYVFPIYVDYIEFQFNKYAYLPIFGSNITLNKLKETIIPNPIIHPDMSNTIMPFFTDILEFYDFINNLCVYIFKIPKLPKPYAVPSFDINNSLIEELPPNVKLIMTVIRINILCNFLINDATFTRIIKALKFLFEHFPERLTEILLNYLNNEYIYNDSIRRGKIPPMQIDIDSFCLNNYNDYFRVNSMYKPTYIEINDSNLKSVDLLGKIVNYENTDVFYSKYMKYKQKYYLLKNHE